MRSSADRHPKRANSRSKAEMHDTFAFAFFGSINMFMCSSLHHQFNSAISTGDVGNDKTSEPLAKIQFQWWRSLGRTTTASTRRSSVRARSRLLIFSIRRFALIPNEYICRHKCGPVWPAVGPPTTPHGQARWRGRPGGSHP